MGWLKSLCIVAAVAAGHANADTLVPGQDDAGFLSARDQWLAGDDLAALTALSGLANDGNTAAQILLARIAANSVFHNHVTGDLPRADRIELLRMPGGLSGKSWLTAAATTSPLAQAFLDAANVETQATAAMTLIEAGETRAALLVAVNRINYGDIETAMAILPPDGDGPLTAVPRYYIRQFMLHGTIAQDLLQGELTTAQQMSWQIPPVAAFRDGTADLAKYADAAAQVPTLNAHRTLCAASCPETQNTCAVVLASASLATVAFATPSEVLIDQATYDSAARVLDDIRRLADNDQTVADDVAALDQCAADLLFVTQ